MATNVNKELTYRDENYFDDLNPNSVYVFSGGGSGTAGQYYTKSELNGGQLDNRYYTESELDARFSLYLPLTGGVLSGDIRFSNFNDGVFFGDGDTGIYEGVDDVLSFKIGAQERWSMTFSSFEGPAATGRIYIYGGGHSLNSPLYSFQGDENTGFSRHSADNLSLIAGGVESLRSGITGVRTSKVENLTGSFISGFAGSGYRLTEDTDGRSVLEADSLYIRGAMTVYELIIDKIRAVNGSLWVSDSGKAITEIIYDSGLDDFYFETEDDVNNFDANDIIKSQQWNGGNIYSDDLEVQSVNANKVYLKLGTGSVNQVDDGSPSGVGMTMFNVDVGTWAADTNGYSFQCANGEAFITESFNIDGIGKIETQFFVEASANEINVSIQLCRESDDSVIDTVNDSLVNGGDTIANFVVSDWADAGINVYIRITCLGPDQVTNFDYDLIDDYTEVPLSAPNINRDWVRMGNSATVARQGSIYITSNDSNAPYIDIIDGVTSDVIASENIKARYGQLTGITDADFGALSGYGLYSENVYLKGSIKALGGEIAGWDISTDAIYTGIKKTTDGFSADGITLAANGSIHAENFYINDDGETAFRTNDGASYLYFFDDTIQMFESSVKLFEVLASTDSGKLGQLDAGSYVFMRGDYLGDDILTYYSPVGIKGTYGGTNIAVMSWEEDQINIGGVYPPTQGLEVFAVPIIYGDTQIGDLISAEAKLTILYGTDGTLSPTYYLTDSALNVNGNISGYIASFYNDGNAVTKAGLRVRVGPETVGSADTYFFRAEDGSGTLEGGLINDSTSFRIYSVSDKRRKKDIEDLDLNALDLLTRNSPKSFRWINENPEDLPERKTKGYIAQDIMVDIPEMVNHDKKTDDYLIADTLLIPYLHKAIIELSDKIKSLEAQISNSNN